MIRKIDRLNSYKTDIEGYKHNLKNNQVDTLTLPIYRQPYMNIKADLECYLNKYKDSIMYFEINQINVKSYL